MLGELCKCVVWNYKKKKTWLNMMKLLTSAATEARSEYSAQVDFT